MRGQSGSSHTSGKATLSGKQGDVERTGGQVPFPRPRRRFRGGGGGRSAGERHRGPGWKHSRVAPGQRVHLLGALRYHQLTQCPIGPR